MENTDIARFNTDMIIDVCEKSGMLPLKSKVLLKRIKQI